ncbi:MAG: hypothetical protein OJF55_000872 [Rhodanobacteraceae bacterium]|nr:MAG: hypothetical protein OJF55_000872 [Rhodanobacteraceae bacterium]
MGKAAIYRNRSADSAVERGLPQRWVVVLAPVSRMKKPAEAGFPTSFRRRLTPPTPDPLGR